MATSDRRGPTDKRRLPCPNCGETTHTLTEAGSGWKCMICERVQWPDGYDTGGE